MSALSVCVCEGGGTIPVCSAQQVGAPQCRMSILRNVNVTCPYRLFSPMSHVEEKYKSHVTLIFSPCRLSPSPMSHVKLSMFGVMGHWGIVLCATPYTLISSLEDQGETLNLICVNYLFFFLSKPRQCWCSVGPVCDQPLTRAQWCVPNFELWITIESCGNWFP